jgi:hypothetical protein
VPDAPGDERGCVVVRVRAGRCPQQQVVEGVERPEPGVGAQRSPELSSGDAATFRGRRSDAVQGPGVHVPVGGSCRRPGQAGVQHLGIASGPGDPTGLGQGGTELLGRPAVERAAERREHTPQAAQHLPQVVHGLGLVGPYPGIHRDEVTPQGIEHPQDEPGGGVRPGTLRSATSVLRGGLGAAGERNRRDVHGIGRRVVQRSFGRSSRGTVASVVRQGPPPRRPQHGGVRVAVVHAHVGDLGPHSAVPAAQGHERRGGVTDQDRPQGTTTQEHLDGVSRGIVGHAPERLRAGPVPSPVDRPVAVRQAREHDTLGGEHPVVGVPHRLAHRHRFVTAHVGGERLECGEPAVIEDPPGPAGVGERRCSVSGGGRSGSGSGHAASVVRRTRVRPGATGFCGRSPARGVLWGTRHLARPRRVGSAA